MARLDPAQEDHHIVRANSLAMRCNCVRLGLPSMAPDQVAGARFKGEAGDFQRIKTFAQAAHVGFLIITRRIRLSSPIGPFSVS